MTTKIKKVNSPHEICIYLQRNGRYTPRPSPPITASSSCHQITVKFVYYFNYVTIMAFTRTHKYVDYTSISLCRRHIFNLKK